MSKEQQLREMREAKFERMHQPKPTVKALRASVDAVKSKRGRKPKAEKSEPWKAAGVSKAKWYRDKNR